MYGLLIGVATTICILSAERLIKNKKLPITNNEFWNLIIIIFFLSIVGGRIYHCVDNYQYYFLNPIKIFFLWNGGFGIFGSIFLVLLFLYFYSRKYKKNTFLYIDLLAFFAPTIQIAGRIGNYFNKELANSSVEIIFLSLLIIIFALISKKLKFGEGIITSFYLIIYAFARIFTEHFRNPVYSFYIMNINLTYTISLFMLLVGFGIIVLKAINKKVNS